MVVLGGLLRMGSKSFLLPVWCGGLLEVGSPAKGSWMCGWSRQLPDSHEISMGAEWATSNS